MTGRRGVRTPMMLHALKNLPPQRDLCPGTVGMDEVMIWR